MKLLTIIFHHNLSTLFKSSLQTKYEKKNPWKENSYIYLYLQRISGYHIDIDIASRRRSCRCCSSRKRRRKKRESEEEASATFNSTSKYPEGKEKIGMKILFGDYERWISRANKNKTSVDKKNNLKSSRKLLARKVPPFSLFIWRIYFFLYFLVFQMTDWMSEDDDVINC